MWKEKEQKINDIIDFCRNSKIKPAFINDELEKIGSTTLSGSTRIYDLLSRPGITMEWLVNNISFMKKAVAYSTAQDKEIAEAVETLIKYSGYIERERNEAEKMHRLEDIHIRGHFNYDDIQSLSTEARQKLTKINPETLAQASRIPGVSPSDINVLLVLMGR